MQISKAFVNKKDALHRSRMQFVKVRKENLLPFKHLKILLGELAQMRNGGVECGNTKQKTLHWQGGGFELGTS